MPIVDSLTTGNYIPVEANGTGTYSTTIPITHIPQGTYTVVVTTEVSVHSQRFTVIR
ncbi:MAG: hypothetical protein JNL32_03980 [Candidatus Kapabacteria bacterium]|nr:hypothetical protein [Candidatus Kapabacteria bacterium]